ncbi:putative glycosyltransferase, involved in aeruginosin biosynthesis [Planktothrix sp. PCC 11201]|uniref:glycosyltransferase family 4 protein n=1 Tax=Planktothrix sp. PCC 11201 TaxID=1729650 RepID=UPI0009142836|nr:glycosyltransferase family 4 protein [Planktothrix sp. PCC 11201]SKB14968.1 putative glycosyltransferase, involved in aeruginosin biosynthesis [Planktothrix sp. PCC 11201]
MKIAFFDYPWSLGEPPKIGSGILCYQLALRLAHSHQLISYGSKAPHHQELEYTEDGITYRRINNNFIDQLFDLLLVLDDWQIFPAKRPFFASKFCNFKYYWQVAKDLQSQDCDIIQINFAFHVAPLIRAFNPQAKIVIYLQTEWLSQLDHQLIEQQLKAVDLVIGCSDYITQKIRDSFPNIPCQTIFNGVDINHFVVNQEARKNKQNEVKTLLFVGRISPEKGVHILLEAFNKVVLKYPQVRLKLVGPEGKFAVIPLQMMNMEDPHVQALTPFYQGEYSQKLRQILSPQAIDSVCFLGPLEQLDLVEHYQDADIFVFPSVWNEPFGIPLVEAMAMELPVVATDSGAFPEIVEAGKTGLLVARSDADALAEAILQLLMNDNLSQSMGKAGRARVVERFTWEKSAQTLVVEYDKMFA